MQKTIKVLLIEDEDSIREIYKTELELFGFNIDDFAMASDGLRAFKNNLYDIVLLDIILLDMNGLDVLKEMRQDAQKKDVPIVLLTSLHQDIIIKQGLKLGATAYLQKDLITPDKLVDKIRDILKIKV